MVELSKFAENRKDKTVLTGQSALAANGLIAGYFIFVIQTDIKNLNGVSLGNIVFEYYHLWDMNNYLNEMEKEFMFLHQSVQLLTVWFGKRRIVMKVS